MAFYLSLNDIRLLSRHLLYPIECITGIALVKMTSLVGRGLVLVVNQLVQGGVPSLVTSPASIFQLVLL